MTTLNIDNLNKLITALEGAADEKFDIRYVYTVDGKYVGWGVVAPRHACGTAACIAGWCGWLMGQTKQDRGEWIAWLGISESAASALFQPEGFRAADNPYTRRRAIATLKHLRDTGEIDWSAPPARETSIEVFRQLLNPTDEVVS